MSPKLLAKCGKLPSGSNPIAEREDSNCPGLRMKRFGGRDLVLGRSLVASPFATGQKIVICHYPSRSSIGQICTWSNIVSHAYQSGLPGLPYSLLLTKEGTVLTKKHLILILSDFSSLGTPESVKSL